LIPLPARSYAALDVKEFLLFLAPADRVVIYTIVRGEIRYDIEQLPQASAGKIWKVKRDLYSLLFRASQFSEAAGDHYARIKLARQQKGLVLDENDLWIAATALALDAGADNS
jgi:predicted nucleic acid-binding protein